EPLGVMPWPAHLQIGTGQLVVDTSFTVAVEGRDARLHRAVERFVEQLRNETGVGPLNLKLVSRPPAGLVIHADHVSKEIPELGEDESYSLEINPSGAKIEAPTTLGAMHGLQTFLQLLQTTADGFAVPAVSIQDSPRFPWRGLMIDVGRHFIPLAM